MADKPTRPITPDTSVRGTTLACSFCGKSQDEVRQLIAGPTVFICNECIDLCVDVVRSESGDITVTIAGPPNCGKSTLRKEFEAVIAKAEFFDPERIKFVETTTES